MKVQNELRALIVKAGLSAPAVSAATYLLIHPMDRPVGELGAYLTRFRDPDLTTKEDRTDALEELQNVGLLQADQKTGGIVYLRLATDVVARLAVSCGTSEQDLQTLLTNAQKESNWTFELMDHTGSSKGFTSWLQALDRAEDQIDIWVTASAYEAVLKILAKKAQQGVAIRVLTGDPALVARVRGRVERKGAEDALQNWREMARTSSGSCVVRAAARVEDLLLAGSSLIDGKVLRLTVFDPSQQRGSQGKLIEVAAEAPRSNVNLVALYSQRFDEAWGRSRRFGFDSSLRLLSNVLLVASLRLIMVMNDSTFWKHGPNAIRGFVASNWTTINTVNGALLVGVGSILFNRVRSWVGNRIRANRLGWAQ